MRMAGQLAVLFLAATVLAGCGKDEAPPTPEAPAGSANGSSGKEKPATTSEIAWGEAANGLRVRLVALGHENIGDGWDLLDAVCPARQCKKKKAAEAKVDYTFRPCPECRNKYATGGVICQRCARRLRVCRFCREAFPTGNCFREGEAIILDVHLENAGETRLQIYDVKWAPNWRTVFTPKDGGVPRIADFMAEVDRVAPLPLVLKKRQTQVVRLDYTPTDFWMFSDARPILYPRRRINPAPPLKFLPPGRYIVTAIYTHAMELAPREICSCWLGKVSTAPVEIEIVPKVP